MNNQNDPNFIQFLSNFHKTRLNALLSEKSPNLNRQKPDIILFETFASLKEVEIVENVILNLLSEQNTKFPKDLEFWVSFTCKNENLTGFGDQIEQCAKFVSNSQIFTGIGINCTKPTFVNQILSKISNVLLQEYKKSKRKFFLVCYPNIGEDFDVSNGNTTNDQVWGKSEVLEKLFFDDQNLLNLMKKYVPTNQADEDDVRHALHGLVIGGCCKTNPNHIKIVADAAKNFRFAK